MDDTFRQHDEPARDEEPSSVEVPAMVDSVTLARLMAEVRNGGPMQPTSYNRMHNRHNRS